MNHYLLSLCSGLLAGIVVSSINVSNVLILFTIVVSIFLFLESYFFEKNNVRDVGLIVSILFLGIFLGQIRVLFFNNSISQDLEKYEGQKINLVGKIISDPVLNGQTQKFVVAVSEVYLNENNKKVSGNVLVTGELFPAYHYGDVLNIKGLIKKPEIISETDSRSFDYPKYLLKDKITETMSFALINKTGKNEGNFIIKFLYSIKGKFVASMQSVLPEPEAGLLAGIVLGTQTISKNLSNDFRGAGLSHIVVLSGYNITIVAESVLILSLFFFQTYAFVLAIISVVIFVLMSGGGASALRAGVMAVVALLGKHFGKTYSSSRALFFAGFIMVLLNPMTLLFDPSFHLSFLATIAMIHFSPIVHDFVKSKLKRIKDTFGLIEMFATTLGIQIFVLPYILYMSGNLSVFALPANMLVLPFVPATMFLGFITSVLGFISHFLGLIGGLPAYFILYYDIFIAETFSHLPMAQISIQNFPLALMLGIYTGLFYFLHRKNSVTANVVSQSSSAEIITVDGYKVID